MIYAIIGDIHSNFDAFKEVAHAIQWEQVDKILCTGDIVGYAAEPNECIALVKDLKCITVAGNHDYATVDKFPVSYFNYDARVSALWTAKQLSAENVEFLKNLPLVVVDEKEGITLVHASLNKPEIFNYIVSLLDAQLNFDLLNTFVCFYGHTHVPIVFVLLNGMPSLNRESTVDLSECEKALVNVGSVGQPRDWDIMASYTVYDSQKKIVSIKRVKYNIQDAMDKIVMAGLPKMNALRLR